MLNLIKQADFFRKIQQDQVVPSKTQFGGFISLFTFIFIVYLVVYQFQYVIFGELVKIPFVQNISNDERIRVNMNITFHEVSCGFLSVDYQDLTGTHLENIQHEIYKLRLDQEGNFLEETKAELIREFENKINNPSTPSLNNKFDEDEKINDCYGAQITVDQKCITCNDVMIAYSSRGWPLPPKEMIKQCNIGLELQKSEYEIKKEQKYQQQKIEREQQQQEISRMQAEYRRKQIEEQQRQQKIREEQLKNESIKKQQQKKQDELAQQKKKESEIENMQKYEEQINETNLENVQNKQDNQEEDQKNSKKIDTSQQNQKHQDKSQIQEDNIQQNELPQEENIEEQNNQEKIDEKQEEKNNNNEQKEQNEQIDDENQNESQKRRQLFAENYGQEVKSDQMFTLDQINNMVDEIGEGCQIYGHLYLKRVPGNFHISLHGQGAANMFIQKLFSMKHTINLLEFTGETEGLTYGNLIQSTNPVDGMYFDVSPGNDQDYYMKIVNAEFKNIFSEFRSLYIYTILNTTQTNNPTLPTVNFKYEFDPISMRYVSQHQSYTHFIVSLCAIFGGTFSLMRYFNSVFSK